MQQFSIPVVYLTAYAEANTVRRASEVAPYGYLLKPVDKDELLSAITRFRNSRKHYSFEEKINLLLSQINPINKIKFNTLLIVTYA